MSTEPAQSIHHGEYKVPGGKLVVADLTVADGVIASASINGDFFLEPDEALEDIDAALVGLAVGTSHEDLAAAVTAKLRSDAVMCGFDARAVATAVRRATVGPARVDGRPDPSAPGGARPVRGRRGSSDRRACRRP